MAVANSPANLREIRSFALARGPEAKTREAIDSSRRHVSLVANDAAAVRGFRRHAQTSTQVASAIVRAA